VVLVGLVIREEDKKGIGDQGLGGRKRGKWYVNTLVC
jgi:hypothetical protein